MHILKQIAIALMLVASVAYHHYTCHMGKLSVNRTEMRSLYQNAWIDGYNAARTVTTESLWPRDSAQWEGQLWRVYVKNQ